MRRQALEACDDGKSSCTLLSPKVINLPEAKPAAFEVYLQYLYTGDVVALCEETRHTDAEDKSDESRTDVAKAQYLVVDTYILAEMLLDIEAKNALIDEFALLIKRGDTLIAVTKINEIFEATPDTSPLRRLLVDYAAFTSSSESFANNGEAFTNEFLVEVCLTLMETRHYSSQKLLEFKHSKCKYHEHASEAHPSCE